MYFVMKETEDPFIYSPEVLYIVQKQYDFENVY